MSQNFEEFEQELSKITSQLSERNRQLSTLPTISGSEAVTAAIESLPSTLPSSGLGTSASLDFLRSKILPGLLQAQNGPRYFGFVTGGVTPAAQLADILWSGYDENVVVTLPGITAGTAVEWRTLELVLDLLALPRDNFPGRAITTGATASNILAMACARDYLYARLPGLPKDYAYAQDGPPSGPEVPSPAVVILGVHPHFSVLKAAALVGLGNGPRVVKNIPTDTEDDCAFDIPALEKRLKEEKEAGRGVIVSYDLGEVNTGACGRGLREVGELCRKYGAWLHVDAAFGGYAAVVPELRELTDGMELADSLTLDGHKWLNVPYDCGVFYCRHASALQDVLGPPKNDIPAYLTVDETAPKPKSENGLVVHGDVPSPLYTNAENSRRFRAFPLLASLMSLGQNGYADFIRRNIDFARRVAHYIHDSPHYDLLNYSPGWKPAPYKEANPLDPLGIIPLNTVLFAPSSISDRFANEKNAGAALTAAINDTRVMYVTGTAWNGRGAVRLAVSNWMTGAGGEEEWEVVKKVLDGVLSPP